MDEVKRFEFTEDVPANAIGDSLEVALMAASSLHGAGRVRLDASCRIDDRARVCEIDASNEVGRTLASVFAGLAEAEFGRDAFTVTRSEARPRRREEAAMRLSAMVKRLEERLAPGGRAVPRTGTAPLRTARAEDDCGRPREPALLRAFGGCPACGLVSVCKRITMEPRPAGGAG